MALFDFGRYMNSAPPQVLGVGLVKASAIPPADQPLNADGYPNVVPLAPTVPVAPNLAPEKAPGDPGYQPAFSGSPNTYQPSNSTAGTPPPAPQYVDPLAGAAPPSGGQNAYPPDELAARRAQIAAQKQAQSIMTYALIGLALLAAYFLLRKRGA